MKKAIYILLSLMWLYSCNPSPKNPTGASPKFIGFWEVVSVQMGDRSMTPVSKWIEFKSDSTYEDGNGWVKKTYGKWTFDPDSLKLAMISTNLIHDEFEPFQLQFSGDTMIWNRQEEGMDVTVKLVTITELPTAPADDLIGLWQLKRIATVTDEKNALNTSQTLFIRPDRLYVHTEKEQREMGYWHVNGHRPELTLIPFDPDLPRREWLISFTNQELVLTAMDDSGLTKTFNRINQLPNN